MKTSSHALPPLIVSTHDAARVDALLRDLAPSEAVTRLEDELARARLVEPARMPPQVVTMNSHVRCVEVASGRVRELQLVYPHDADAAAGRVSVLAPVGSALLGLATGGIIEWPMPGGRHLQLRVDAVTWQPEAHGRLD